MMPLPCTVCHHPERERIDKEVAHAAKSRKDIAKGYGLAPSSLGRHIAHSVQSAGMVLRAKTGGRRTPRAPSGQVLGSAQFRAQVHAGVAQMLSGATLAQEVGRLRDRADAICRGAEQAGEDGAAKDPRTALLAIRELTRLLELQGRMLLEQAQGRASDVSAHPVWMTLSSLIMGAIGSCPACRASVAVVIRERLGVDIPAQPSKPTTDNGMPFP